MSDLGNREIFSKNLKRLLEQNSITQKELCIALNFKESTFSDWIQAKSYPRIDKIEMMANFFKVQKSDLIEKYDPDRNSLSLEEYVKLNKKLPNIMRVLFRDGGKMTPEREKLVARIIETAIEEK